jgi:hypothetical protein
MMLTSNKINELAQRTFDEFFILERSSQLEHFAHAIEAEVQAETLRNMIAATNGSVPPLAPESQA